MRGAPRKKTRAASRGAPRSCRLQCHDRISRPTWHFEDVVVMLSSASVVHCARYRAQHSQEKNLIWCRVRMAAPELQKLITAHISGRGQAKRNHGYKESLALATTM